MPAHRYNYCSVSLREVGVVLLVGTLASISPASCAASGKKQAGTNPMPLKRVTPVGWFTMLVPSNTAAMETKADIDGGFFGGTPIQVSFSYYAYVNTPNFLIDGTTGRPYPASRRPVPGARKKQIGGRSAWISTLREDHRGDGYRYGYYVEFFNLPVPIGDGGMLQGTINFEISTNNALYLPYVRRIVESIRFYRKPQPNKGMHRSARREFDMNPGVRLARPVMPDVRRLHQASPLVLSSQRDLLILGVVE